MPAGRPKGQPKTGGRKKGSLTKRTQEIAAKAMADGITPLEVMLRAMRNHADAGRWDEAAERAKEAAPYIHPRLAAVAHSGPDGEKIGFTFNLDRPHEDERHEDD